MADPVLRIVSIVVQRESGGWTIEVDSDLDPWSTLGILEGAVEEFRGELYPPIEFEQDEDA